MKELRAGDCGTAIGLLQQSLIENGASIEATELTIPRFGATTLESVLAFQSHHVGPDGHVLTQDGVVGDETWWALLHPSDAAGGRYTAPGWRCAPTEARASVVPVLQAAVGEIGLHEDPDGSNRGPEIDKYGADGQPWCAFFASWCYGHAEGGSPFGVMGSALKIYNWAKTNNRFVMFGPAMSGDIFVILRSDGHGHVGLVAGTADDDASKAFTIEGNASNAVRGIIRDRLSFAGLVRPIPVT